MLIAALDDPATARLVARRLLLPAFPIQGSNPIYASEVLSGDATQRTFGGGSGDFAFPARLGIGTADPLRKLHIADDTSAYLRLSGAGAPNPSNAGRIEFSESPAGTAQFTLGHDGVNNRLQLDTSAVSGALTVLRDSGNVGIGTTNPTSRLHVVDTKDSGWNTFFRNLSATSGAFVGLQFNTWEASGGEVSRAAIRALQTSGQSDSSGELAFLTRPAASGAMTERVRIDRNGNVGTTSPDNKLHVMDGHVAIEAAAGQGKLKFRQSGTTRNEIYRDSADFTVLRNWNQVYTNLKIWAPQESSFPTTPREATLALVRALDDESKTEFLDLYNNHYSTEKQYGIRIGKSGDGTSFHDFVFDQYDDDEDKKTPLMILKVDGKVGVGTDVPGARLEAADPSVLAGENLTNGALTGGTSWSAAGDMALASNAATYTHSTGAGTLTQTSGSFAIAAKPYRLYLFTYTISGMSGTPPSASISTAFGAESRPLKIKADGTYTDAVLLHATASPGNFVISVTSSVAGSFTIDSLSLKEVTGGDIIADGLFTGGGPTGIKVDNAGNVGIGTSSPAPSAKLEILSTTGALLVPRMNTTQRDNLSPLINGMIIFNTTTGTFQGYDGTSWNNL